MNNRFMGKEQSKYTVAIGIFPRKMLQSILIGAFILLSALYHTLAVDVGIFKAKIIVKLNIYCLLLYNV